MAQQTINVGSSANSGGGDPLRNALIKVNENFTEVYAKLTALEDGSITTNIVGELKGTVYSDDSTLLVDGTNGKIVGPIDTVNPLITGTIDSADSTAITFVPPVVAQGDVTVENDLTVNGKITGHISVAELKTIVAASADFDDFKTRIAAL